MPEGDTLSVIRCDAGGQQKVENETGFQNKQPFLRFQIIDPSPILDLCV